MTRISDLFCYFEEKEALPKITVASLISMVPVVNLFFLGYLYRYGDQVLRGDGGALPEWKPFKTLFQDGWNTFLVLLLIFSPATILFGMAVLFFYLLVNYGISNYVEYAVVSVLCFLLCFFAAGFSFFLHPLSLFRLIEGGEIAWAVWPSEILSDLTAMGWPYKENFLYVFSTFVLGEFVLSGCGAFIGGSPLGIWVGWSFVVLGSAFLISYLGLYLVKIDADLYAELHYRYDQERD